MKIPFVDLKTQYRSIKSEIDHSVQRVIENAMFIGGPEVQNFQQNFRTLYGVNNCVTLANGTDAIYIALKMLGIGSDDEVITTASSWISTSETISQTGAKPVFVDIDEFYTIDVSKIESKINKNTKAIIPVHLYGQMCNMEEIIKIAEHFRLEVIEDCAQSHFSELNGVRAGLWGRCGTFSFYPGKNLGAYGDAGALITNDDELALNCKRFANHGALTKHHHEIEGINSRLDGIQAAVLNVKLKYIQEWTEKRIEVANYYFNNLQHIEQMKLPQVRQNSKHSFHVFGIKTKRRSNLRVFLKEKGIDTQIHYPTALPFMPAYANYNAKSSDFPNSFELQEMELSLPIYPEISIEQLDYICTSINEFYKNS